MRFIRNQNGGAMIIFGLLLPVILGIGALAIDLSYLYVLKTQLQTTADAATLAAVMELPDEDAAKQAALELTDKNMSASSHGIVLADADIQFGSWDAGIFTAGATPTTAIQVTTRRADVNGNPVGLFLARVFGQETANVVARSTAVITTSTACIVALNPSDIDSIRLDSNARLTANGCTVQVNSAHHRALYVRSNAFVEADHVCVNGDYSGRDEDFEEVPDTGCGVVDDPLAGTPTPEFSGCDYTDEVYDGRITTINNNGVDPVVFCGGMEIGNNSEVTFDPGIYVIDGGEFDINSNAVLNAEGVTFYFTNGGNMDFSSNTVVNFSAPIDGDTAGLIFFQDPNDVGTVHTFNSNTVANLEGTIYLPTGTLHLDSNSEFGLNAPYTVVIADTFDLDSNAGLTVNANIDDSDVPLADGLEVLIAPQLVM